MDRDAAVAQVQMYLGFRSDKAAEIVTAMQNVQNELERNAFLPWFLLVQNSDLTTVADTQTVALPSDFLRGSDDLELFYYNAGATDEDEVWNRLKEIDPQALRQVYQDKTGVPEAFYYDKTNVHFGPTPDDVYTIKFQNYYGADATLDAGTTENEWLKYAHDLIIGRAGNKIASALRDRDAQTFFMKMGDTAWADLIRETTAREEAGIERQMGGVE